ncbi:MAG: methionyl-tRNA formyltransferase [Myxococcota bacterium]
MRVVFFGSPAFAVPCLDAVHEFADVAAVISQPDRPAGRGMSLRAPAVKVRAEELGLPVWQPRKVRTADFAERVRSLEADVGVVVAYGRILPRAVLDAPRLGCVNVHGSILPRWRGAAPIQWAIASGDAETGVTLMQMDEGMDTGPMLAVRRTAIEPAETTSELAVRLSALGASLLREELAQWVDGTLSPTPQPDDGVTMARLLTKDDGRLTWEQSAQEVHDRVRGMTPWPGAFTFLEDRRVKVHQTRVISNEGSHGTPGEVVGTEGVHVACGTGTLAIEVLQDPNRKRLDAKTYRAGRSLGKGTRFRSEESS